MSQQRMHADEVVIDADLVHRLILSQHPQWADLAIEPVASTGTVNAIWRLGTDMYVRMPRVQAWAGDLENELRWLPVLGPQLSVDVPNPIAAGEPQFEYPFRWAIFSWHEGETFVPGNVDDCQAAADLAQFVAELRRINTKGAPRCHRDRPLQTLDAAVRTAMIAAGDLIDRVEVVAAWDAAVGTPSEDHGLVWTHADLLPPNALVVDGRIGAIIDFGGAGVGDPAVDVIAAWSMLDHNGRDIFRAMLDVDDGTWARARGLALHQALEIIPYYIETNPAFAAMAQRTVNQITGST